MKLEWISNDMKDWRRDRLSKEWANHEKWRSKFIEGEPQVPPGSKESVESLKRMGLVGLYRNTEVKE